MPLLSNNFAKRMIGIAQNPRFQNNARENIIEMNLNFYKECANVLLCTVGTVCIIIIATGKK